MVTRRRQPSQRRSSGRPRAPAPHAQPAQPSREQALLELQSTVGNRAIQALLGLPDANIAGPASTGIRATAPAVARKRTRGPAIGAHRQRSIDDLVARVRENLSYGLFDWAITDAEARNSLELLGGLNGDSLRGALNQLGAKYVRRLLANVPEDARRTAHYTKVVVALGPSGVQPYIESLLSYGLFDWVITDAEVTQVFRIVGALASDAQVALLGRIHASNRLHRLIGNANAAHHRASIRPLIAAWPQGEALTAQQKTLLRVVFDSTSDAVLETLKLCMAQRFALQIGGATTAAAAGETAIDWEPGGLRRMYPVLEALPSSHVAQNARLISMGRYQSSGVEGYYWRDEAAIGYAPGRLREREQTDRGDPLRGVNRFDTTVRHEVGHAVDAQLGWASGPGPAQPSRGGWRSYADLTACAGAMVGDAGGAIQRLPESRRNDVIGRMVKAMQDRDPDLDALKAAIGRLGWFRSLSAGRKAAILRDTALSALTTGLRNPWYRRADGGVHLGDHVYQESYELDWTRYRHEARERKVSQYQFRAPGEWFAEAYAAYYEPDRRGRGAKLADRDVDTKRYFDNVVHRMAASR